MRICAGGRAAEVVEGGQDIQRSVEMLPRNHRDKAQGEVTSRANSDFGQPWAGRRVEMRLRLSWLATGKDLGGTRHVCGMGLWRWTDGCGGVGAQSSQESSSSDDQSVQASPNAECTLIHSTRGQMDLADPSHPSSNPLILGMSWSAGCEATGQWAPIRKMAGFDASRGTGGTKKVKENGTISYHR